MDEGGIPVETPSLLFETFPLQLKNGIQDKAVWKPLFRGVSAAGIDLRLSQSI